MFRQILLSAVAAVAFAADAPPVPVYVLTEAFWGGCASFVTSTLKDTMDSIGDIVNLTAVPYGNADIDVATKTVTCQHGDDECSANLFEQCAMSLNADDQTAWFAFYVCMENAGESMIDSTVMQACAKSAGVDGDAIQACHDDPDQAWASQLAASEATDPAHEYTPWVVVGGTGPYYTDGTLLQYEELLTRTVCNEYTGTKPAGCPSSDARDFKA